MSLEELYREVILDHYRNPRNRGKLSDPDASADGSNPLCGDDVHIDLALDGELIVAVGVTGQGCSISQASASMMSEAVAGRTVADAEELTARFKGMMSIEQADPGLDPERPGAALGDLEALQGVRKFPVRIKCADLPWTTLTAALASRPN